MPNISFQPVDIWGSISRYAPETCSISTLRGYDALKFQDRAITFLDVGDVRIEGDEKSLHGTSIPMPIIVFTDRVKSAKVFDNLPAYMAEGEEVYRSLTTDDQPVWCRTVTINIEWARNQMFHAVAGAFAVNRAGDTIGPVQLAAWFINDKVYNTTRSSIYTLKEAMLSMIRLSIDCTEGKAIVLGSAPSNVRTMKVRVYDRTRPHVEHMSLTLGQSASIGTTFELTIQRRTDAHFYVSKFDLAFDTASQRAAARAFAAGKGHLSSDAEPDEPVRRSRPVQLDTSVPFPDYAFSDLANPDHLLLTLALLPNHGFRFHTPVELERADRPRIYVHATNDYVRFIFIDTFDTEVASTGRVYASRIMPIAVPKDECSVSAPVPVMRGMDPNVLAAMRDTPYFASALGHAINRRKYLFTKLPEFKPGAHSAYTSAGVPVLWRSNARGSFKPDQYSKAGRKVCRSDTHTITQTLRTLMAGLPQTTLPMARVQPVAPMTGSGKSKRAIVLD